MVNGKRRIVVDVFEVTHSEDLGDGHTNYTKKKIGTQVHDFEPDQNLGVTRANIAESIIHITKGIT